MRQRCQEGSAPHVPNPRGVVVARGYEPAAIATDRHLGPPLVSAFVRQGVQQPGTLAQHCAEVDIVTVSEPWAVGMYDAMGWSVGYMNSPEYKADREEGAQKVLQPALAKAAEQGITATPVHVLDRYAADGIIETAGQRNSDLIVMTSHGRRGVTRVLLGSQTAEVLARSTLPVLVIR